jgi:hypothetical protein
MKDYPTNKEEYFQLVDQHWSDLINIISQFVPQMVDRAEKYRRDQDKKLSDIFQEAWAAAPDSFSLHYIPSWHILCDLCSEAYVLFDYDEAGNPL